jgi:hypothetical protein
MKKYALALLLVVLATTDSQARHGRLLARFRQRVGSVVSTIAPGLAAAAAPAAPVAGACLVGDCPGGKCPAFAAPAPAVEVVKPKATK